MAIPFPKTQFTTAVENDFGTQQQHRTKRSRNTLPAWLEDVTDQNASAVASGVKSQHSALQAVASASSSHGAQAAAQLEESLNRELAQSEKQLTSAEEEAKRCRHDRLRLERRLADRESPGPKSIEVWLLSAVLLAALPTSAFFVGNLIAGSAYFFGGSLEASVAAILTLLLPATVWGGTRSPRAGQWLNALAPLAFAGVITGIGLGLTSIDSGAASSASAFAWPGADESAAATNSFMDLLRSMQPLFRGPVFIMSVLLAECCLASLAKRRLLHHLEIRGLIAEQRQQDEMLKEALRSEKEALASVATSRGEVAAARSQLKSFDARPVINSIERAAEARFLARLTALNLVLP